MKNTIRILLTLVLIPVLGFCKRQSLTQREKQVLGAYYNLGPNKLSGTSLILKPDHTFEYNEGSDLSVYHCLGKWSLKRDTLTLNSAISKNDIPIKVKEEVIDSISDYIAFDWINNLDNDAMVATLSFNSDTSIKCDPLMGTDCMMKIGSVDSILVQLGNYAKSKWYTVRDKKINKLSVTVLVHEILDKYSFLEEEKYLYKNGNLVRVYRDSDAKQSLTLKKVKQQKNE
ncbi:hypothetical protein [Taibaiella chishuiensis]|uniref:Uncharacterized protein n=1 Tax=Taibaiella chishuiensis TaxID=1434707 RepID=A0A2P8CPI1_9BACT|nr:hypothetical protein [Taibaiella chishuiensis]PSK86875.1 hypothetical protein B0I18_1191 [Taibaiella chishuiensis]